MGQTRGEADDHEEDETLGCHEDDLGGDLRDDLEMTYLHSLPLLCIYTEASHGSRSSVSTRSTSGITSLLLLPLY